MTRLEANLHIMGIIGRAVMENPDMRFGQLLRNLDVVKEDNTFDENSGFSFKYWVDEFYGESEELLNRMYKNKLVQELTDND